ALGIGANAAIFTLVNAVLLKSLPVADPKTLVRIGDQNQCCISIGSQGHDGDYSLFATETWQILKKNAPEFEELAAMQAGFGYRPIVVRRDGDPSGSRSLMGEFVSGNYFRTFGLSPHWGRLLTDSDDTAGAPVVAVMSYQTWRRDYAGDPSVVGSIFWVNTKPVTVTGIAPAGFYGDRMISTPPDFYLPIESMPVLANAPHVHNPDARWLYLVGRVKPGVNLPQLQTGLSALVRQAFAQTEIFSKAEGKAELPKVHVVLTPAGGGVQVLQEEYASNLKMLMIISGLVLLIACANIANLLLARGMARKAELSVRTALGAGRARIVRQLLTESIVLAVLSGIAGLAVAYAGTRMLLALAFPGNQSVPIDASPSPEVLAFACGLSIITGVLFGMAPAWIAAQAEPIEALRSGGRTTAAGASLLQRGLVVLQAALSLVLLVGAGLFTQSLNKLQRSDLKLDARNRYIVHIDPQAAGYSQTQLDALYRLIEDRFHSIPGVVNVGISSYTPMEDDNWGTGIQIQGKPDPHFGASFVRVSPEYFDSVGTRVLVGRGISQKDTPGNTNVAVVNQEFVKKFFKPGENPIGQHFGSPGDPSSWGNYEIVGVVEDTTYVTPRLKNHSMYFVPLMQRPASDKDPIEKDISLYAGAVVLQTSHPMPDMEALTRQTLASINPNLTVEKFQTFDEQIADRFVEDRMIARLTMLFGVLALLLATVGLYGVTAYTVARRTGEIGIRMALGAERSSVIAMIMRGAMLQTAFGLAIGIPVAFVCVRFVKSQLYEIRSADPSVMATAILGLTLAATLAGLIPARRAASTDPAKALRTE
ncbi:MAG: ABC transporter permease, partial [Silvibacterium sp.]|nr:ABC transporter permease [Silvibacterium sp.]